jgi:hypothetical protein
MARIELTARVNYQGKLPGLAGLPGVKIRKP